MGVWHKHPLYMPYPSNGDVSSAMEEVADTDMALSELITPICIVESGQVQVLPFAIRDSAFREIEWTSMPNNELPEADSLQVQWYETEIGNNRLGEELSRFDAAGIQVEILKGNDNTYRIDVTLAKEPDQRLVILCPAEYPAIGPEVAIYNKVSNEYEPFISESLSNWNIFIHFVDVVQEYQDNKFLPDNRSRWQNGLPPRNWVRHGHQASKILHSLCKIGVQVTKWPVTVSCKISDRAGRLEKWFDERDQFDYVETKADH